MTLYQSPVEFVEEPHGYYLEERRMSGITSLIHQVLNLGVYPDASEFVKTVAIPRAGEYGKAVHHAIESYDTMGLKVTMHPKSARFRKHDLDEYWEVADELETYIRHREGFVPVANEYTVSDEERYASNIDNVWLKEGTEEIWLVDTKTNNLAYYPGGEEALKEYLSWQLSVYAYLFERQNPFLKVASLACNWLRGTDGAFWLIDRKSDEQVRMLLSVPWAYIDGHFVYDGHDVAQMLLGKPGLVETAPKQIVSKEVVAFVESVARQAEETRRLLDELKETLRGAMLAHGVKSWDSGVFKATIREDSTAETFDTTRFRKDHPELYKEYLKQTTRKGGFTIKLKD